MNKLDELGEEATPEAIKALVDVEATTACLMPMVLLLINC